MNLYRCRHYHDCISAAARVLCCTVHSILVCITSSRVQPVLILVLACSLAPEGSICLIQYEQAKIVPSNFFWCFPAASPTITASARVRRYLYSSDRMRVQVAHSKIHSHFKQSNWVVVGSNQAADPHKPQAACFCSAPLNYNSHC